MGFWGTLGQGLGGLAGLALGPVGGLVAGAGLGLAKHAEDKSNAKNQDILAAATDQYSPWTGLHGKMAANPSLVGSVVQGGATGLDMAGKISKMGLGGGDLTANPANADPSSAPSMSSLSVPSGGAAPMGMGDPNDPYGMGAQNGIPILKKLPS